MAHSTSDDSAFVRPLRTVVSSLISSRPSSVAGACLQASEESIPLLDVDGDVIPFETRRAIAIAIDYHEKETELATITQT